MNYFGARYLDPMLGLWISVDAARQYQNPYAYIGNNPICGIDEDGLWGFDVNVGFRAAVIAGGGVSFRWSFDSNDPSKNKAYISVSYGVGLEVGLPIKSKSSMQQVRFRPIRLDQMNQLQGIIPRLISV